MDGLEQEENKPCECCGFKQIFLGYLIRDKRTGKIRSSIFENREMLDYTYNVLVENHGDHFEIVEIPVEQEHH